MLLVIEALAPVLVMKNSIVDRKSAEPADTRRCLMIAVVGLAALGVRCGAEEPSGPGSPGTTATGGSSFATRATARGATCSATPPSRARSKPRSQSLSVSDGERGE